MSGKTLDNLFRKVNETAKCLLNRQAKSAAADENALVDTFAAATAAAVAESRYVLRDANLVEDEGFDNAFTTQTPTW